MAGKIAEVIDVANCATIGDMLRASNTDWDVDVRKASWEGSVGNSGGFSALVRPDNNTALAYVGGRYRTNQHRDQLHKLDGLVSQGDILPQSVSVWDNGAILAYQFRCPMLDVNIMGKDVVSPLLTLAFSYGFRLADSAFFSDFRWFCKNQLGKVAELTAGARVRHRGDVVGRYDDVLARRITELGGELSDRYDAMRRMPSVQLTGRQLVEYVGEVVQATPEEVDKVWVCTEPKELVGAASKVSDILECYQEDGCGAEGTVWQAYNACTRYLSHKAGRNEANRQRNMLLGAGSGIANRAWELAAKRAA